MFSLLMQIIFHRQLFDI